MQHEFFDYIRAFLTVESWHLLCLVKIQHSTIFYGEYDQVHSQWRLADHRFPFHTMKNSKIHSMHCLDSDVHAPENIHYRESLKAKHHNRNQLEYKLK